MIFLDSYKLAEEVIIKAKDQLVRIGTAESCTGGMLSCYLTAVPGSSQVFERGYVTYTEKSKREVLMVSSKVLNEQGAVCEEVARQMLSGLFELSSVHMGISITGIAGPSGGSSTTPVGLVYIGYGSRGDIKCKKYTFVGDRNEIRQQATVESLRLLIKLLSF
ncbi:CinA-like protein [endosymbiont of Acanthamoeba sp. UWC8]|uniref:CinA family protein n=1 Tax=endosymbiont of Acanthamoeba sp. UWC8 TaxID=86106 RepID=UPI0004D1CC77|nr:CinA family protein [endosymbiont of Acanthamoeba sp. UWC8]AIF81608.1 CinA-like protein [endosymbiont of Acanthamoeba sp. UWC8]